MKRTIVVGDIHGCLEEFDELLKLIGYRVGDNEDHLILLGDLIDRGPDPIGVVRRAREIGAECVLGNHEEKALRWLRHAAVERTTGKKNPMRRPQAERLKEWEALSEEDLQWLGALPLHIEFLGEWLAVHAGFEPGLPLEKQKKDRVIRVRFVDAGGLMVPYTDGSLEQPPNTVYWTEQWVGARTRSVVFGHAVQSLRHVTILTSKRSTTISLDTGCVFGGHLSAAIWEEHRTVADLGLPWIAQVKAKREYHPPLAC